MKPKNEELLYFLLWTADSLMRPTWRNLNGSFEEWAWRNGLNRRLATLARDQLIERHPEPNLDRMVRLTEAGRQLALGGRDPLKDWTRPWDGQWRLLMFDVPSGHDDLRQNLLRTLRSRHFGCLQRSVWVTPDPTSDVRAILGETRVQADAFLVIEGKPATGESDAEIVAGAWDFDSINEHYARYVAFASKPPAGAGRIGDWARRENALWKAALQSDPLLPIALLPADYRGREALQRRKSVLAHLSGRLDAEH